jgi:hypothetical protein
MERPNRVGPRARDGLGIVEELRARHREEEIALLDALSASCDEQGEGRWAALRSELCAHADYEERTLFEAYARDTEGGAEVAAGLRQQHADLLRRIDELFRCWTAQAVKADVVSSAVSALRHHAAREDVTVYVWLEDKDRARKRRRAP